MCVFVEIKFRLGWLFQTEKLPAGCFANMRPMLDEMQA